MQRRSSFGLIAALLVFGSFGGLQGAADPVAPDGFLGAFNWRMDDPSFGGFSAIEISQDGTEFIALSDRGGWTRGKLTRDETGLIVDFTPEPMQKLKATGDAPLKRNRADSEGMALAPDGTIYVSFEGVARVLRYKTFGARAENLPSHPDFAKMPRNGSLEALAIDARGQLWTLPEETADKKSDFPLYRFDGEAWHQPFTLPRRGNFLPVSADFGPDGKFYLLERAFYGLGGFASRLRRFSLSDEALGEEEVLLETSAGKHDNLEGLSVWQDREGAIRVTMVSDDNHRFFLRNQILEYRFSPNRGQPSLR